MRIVFNNTDLSTILPDTVMHIGNVQGREFLSPDVTTVAYKGTHGSRFVTSRYPSRTITVDVTIVGYCADSMPSYASQLMTALAVDTPAALSFSDQEGMFQAIVSAVDLDEHATYADGTITFTCPQPFRYGELQEVDFSTLESAVLQTNYTVEPTLYLIVNGSASMLEVNVNGESLTLDMNVSNGDVIVINSETRTVTVNNKLVVLELSGTFPTLKRTGNTIRFSTPCSGNGSYVARWL